MKAKDRTEYFKEYNAVRRERYHNNPEHRQRILERERERYRKTYKPVKKGYGSNAGKASKYAVSCLVLTEDGNYIPMGVLTVPRMSEFLGVTYFTLRRWIERGLFPAPNKESKCRRAFYTQHEANGLARVLYAKMRGAKFKDTDTEVTKALFDEFNNHQ